MSQRKKTSVEEYVRGRRGKGSTGSSKASQTFLPEQTNALLIFLPFGGLTREIRSHRTGSKRQSMGRLKTFHDIKFAVHPVAPCGSFLTAKQQGGGLKRKRVFSVDSYSYSRVIVRE